MREIYFLKYIFFLSIYGVFLLTAFGGIRPKNIQKNLRLAIVLRGKNNFLV